MRYIKGRRKLLRVCSIVLLTLFWCYPISASAAPRSLDNVLARTVAVEVKEQKLAVIIDDLGNGMKGTEEIMMMPVKLTVAVMPFLPTTVADARRAHEQGHDVILHLPMEPKQGNPKWLGPGAILSNMTDQDVRQRVEAAIDNVPFAVGINNHMGSRITGDERVMSIILDVCRERGLFFIDSRTNYRSVVSKLSGLKGMPEVHNHIFLDDVHTERHISGQLLKVQEQLMQEGRCVTIGHVGVHGLKTASVLKQSIPAFQKQGVTFVGVADLVAEKESPGLSPGPGVILP
ncbi:divergent polysaccharide deacetylase family protein [Paenibacillus anaericanus]|uniref:Divergent polysaccharide deacetylase family protein n=1 Tax=Paenibacillus anaericanus TaxID=170367 RepID=A0A3S1BQA1_9BACL|nr:divergent polysaccharide deacetylase family protein [Paenibacillus anaericanus]RUT47033.1 divergent polysaccharide deacetylase family protein [Paenibacillus anaericanus]